MSVNQESVAMGSIKITATLKYDVAARSVVGSRPDQQDCVFASINDSGVFAVVCDGMGGLDGGSAASNVAVNTLKQLYEQRDPKQSIPDFFLYAVDIMDEKVASLKNEYNEKLSAGTTVVALVMENDDMYWLSVGDSRLYVVRGGEMLQVTRDHNYFLSLNTMLEANEITLEQYENETSRGEALVSFIGIGGVRLMDINASPLCISDGDIMLATSDGIYKTLPENEILHILCEGGTAHETANQLLAQLEAHHNPGQDNASFVLIKLSDKQ